MLIIETDYPDSHQFGTRMCKKVNEKKLKIIRSAMKLFAQKGLDATSIQEIADRSGISKGAFYLHFRSKEELLLSLFQYDAEKIDEIIAQAEQQDLPARDKFVLQLTRLFQHLLDNREIIILNFREEVLHINKEMAHFFRKLRQKQRQWLENVFLSIYGETVRPYLYDATVIFHGIMKSYLMLMIVHRIELDVERLARFIVNRLDEVVNGMVSGRQKPLLTQEMLAPLYAPANDIHEQVIGILEQMKDTLNRLDMNEAEKGELFDSIKYLLAEFKKGQPPTFMVKGLLANFSKFGEFDHYRQAIADLMGIEW